MPRPSSDALRRLAAELDTEATRIDRTVTEGAVAFTALQADTHERLQLYGAAAILDTYYTGVEKAFSRIAMALDGGVPQGQAWHRQLLEDMAITIAEVRPAVLSAQTLRELEPFLGFRHRFRNLYLFDLEAQPLRSLLAGQPASWATLRADLVAFCAFLRRLADQAP